MAAWCSLVAMCIAVVGCLYTIAAVRAVRGFVQRPANASASRLPAVSLLKPLHGAEPGLYESLLSFLHQDGVGAVQMIFGVAGEHDPAVPVVRRLMRAFPDRDLELVVSQRPVDGNGKIANLAAMSAAVKHEIIVLSDSDIRVTPSYLQDVCAALAEPDVGLVTCLYRGGDGQSAWSRLSTMAIDFHFLPSVLVGVRHANARPCLGATMALSAATLERIGGFEAFSRHLADDYAIGEAVRATGQRVVLARQIVVHQCNEQSATEVFLHELRWARTIRCIDPWGYGGSFVTHPLPFAIVALLLDPDSPAAVACVLSSLACRLLLQRRVEIATGVSTHRWILGPVRDLLAFAVYVASFATDSVVWRGERYRVRSDGTMEKLERAFARVKGDGLNPATRDDAPRGAGRPT